ncbi:MAG: hypothetical protein PWQ11_492 [Candidatus Diapherotrites archaeon]|nr:hypothetical protein [Candidatus Diapherotrites archaeon]
MIREIRKAFEEEDDEFLRNLAVEMAKNAAVDQDKQKARLAVIAYALSKILAKPHFKQSPNWPRYRNAIISALRDAEMGRETNVIERVERTIRRIDEEDGHFVKNIMDKARSKMAAIAYSVGISTSIAAHLFDADKNDLLDYIGKMKVHDEHIPRIGIKERIEALRRMQHANSG